MTIAVYANLARCSFSDAYPRFVKALIGQLAKAHPHDNFYWIKEEGLPGISYNYENLKTISIEPPGKLFYNFSLNRKINGQIKKFKVDALLSVDTIIDTTKQQCLIISHTDKQLQKADLGEVQSAFCLSETIKSNLEEQYESNAQKIHLIYGGPSLDLLLSNEEEKAAVKEKYTEGKEYFLYRGSFDSPNVVQLLKAFSIFKKRQKSTMKMLLLGEDISGKKEFSELLSTYKYREDVVLANVEENTEIELVAGAFAYIQPYRSNSLCFVFDALQNNIPALIDASSPLLEIDSEAALCFDTHSAEDIADALMRIYKDERLYGDLIEKGKELIKKDYWKQTTDLIRNSFLQVKAD
jgi:glycosyltransferase involved in cell wall biosynthesis